MIKQFSIVVASVSLLSACSSFQAAEPQIYTIGDETTTSQHYFNDGSNVMIEDVSPMRDHSSMKHNPTKSEPINNDVNVINDISYVLFSFDSSALSMDARSQLSTVADKIRETNPEEVVVEGHCDERGTREYNLALGDRRAVAIKKYLVGLGVESSKLSTISYGKERPRNPSHNAGAWAENRRGVVNFK